jgi:hypothetical protein
MRVFWHQGGLHIQPQTDDETQALIRLLDMAGTEPEPEAQTGSGSSELGSDGLLDDEIAPRRFTRKPSNEDAVIIIDVGR